MVDKLEDSESTVRLRCWCVEQAAFILKNSGGTTSDVVRFAEEILVWVTK